MKSVIKVSSKVIAIKGSARLTDFRIASYKEKFQPSTSIDLKELNCNVEVYDPWVNKNEANIEYGINPVRSPSKRKYDVIVIAVAHDEFRKLTIEQIHAFGKENHVLYDIKYLLEASQVDGRL